MILPDRPRPLKGGVLNKVSAGVWVLPREDTPAPPPPPPIPNVDFCPSSGGAEWEEWADNRGYGLKSRWQWFWSRGDELSSEEMAWAAHLRLERRHECHQHRSYIYCYHRDPHVHPELRNVPTDEPIANTGMARS